MQFKEGDLFYWSYKDKSNSGWCCSWKAMFKNGYIMDLYWHGSSDCTKLWTPENAIKLLDLEFKGNINDLKKIDAARADYYDPLNLTDLRHPNNTRGEVYIREGAKPDKARVLKMVQDEVENYKYAAEYALRREKECLEIIDKINSDFDLENIYIPRSSR